MGIRGRRPPDRPHETAAIEASPEQGPAGNSLISLLVEAGVASEVELRQMAAEADAQGIGLGELVVGRGLLDEEAMAQLVARGAGLPFLPRGSLTIDPTAARLLAFEQASTLRGCVIGIREGGPLVVVDDPSAERLDALRAQVEGAASVSFAVVTASSLQGLLGQLARLNGRRANASPDGSPLTRTSQPAAGKRAESIASGPAASDQLLADLQRAAATERTLLARLDRLESEREAANQQIERLQHQLVAVDHQRVSEHDHGSEVQARLDQLDSERDAAYQQIEQLHQQIEPLQQQIEQLQQQLETIDQQRASERDHDSALQARLEQLESERDAANQQTEQLQQQLEAVDRQRVSERDHGSQLQARLDQLESEQEAATQQIDQLRQQLAAVDQQRMSEGDHDSQPPARPEDQPNHLERENHELRRKLHELLIQRDSPEKTTSREMAEDVPLIDVRLLEGVFSRDERRQLAKSLITAVVGVKGESFRDQAEVLVAERQGPSSANNSRLMSR